MKDPGDMDVTGFSAFVNIAVSVIVVQMCIRDRLIIIKTASSDVAINTDRRVPTDMIPPAYRFAAITENPH